MSNVGGQSNVFFGVSGADLFLSVFSDRSVSSTFELDVGAARRLNDTLTVPPARLHSEHARPAVAPVVHGC